MIAEQKQALVAGARSVSSDLTMIQYGDALISKIKKTARLGLSSLYVVTQGEKYVGWKTLERVDCPI